jgi:hypothetical protein
VAPEVAVNRVRKPPEAAELLRAPLLPQLAAAERARVAPAVAPAARLQLVAAVVQSRLLLPL